MGMWYDNELIVSGDAEDVETFRLDALWSPPEPLLGQQALPGKTLCFEKLLRRDGFRPPRDDCRGSAPTQDPHPTWGVRWEAGNARMFEDRALSEGWRRLRYVFSTRDTSAEPFMYAISAMHPRLKFDLTYLECNCCATGRFHFVRGTAAVNLTGTADVEAMLDAAETVESDAAADENPSVSSGGELF